MFFVLLGFVLDWFCCFRWQKAHESGAFNDEIAPVTIKGKKGDESYTVDEHPRGKTTIEELTKLPTVFKKVLDPQNLNNFYS